MSKSSTATARFAGYCRACKLEYAEGDAIHAVSVYGSKRDTWCADAKCVGNAEPQAAKPEAAPKVEQQASSIPAETSAHDKGAAPTLSEQQRQNLAEHYAGLADMVADGLTEAEAAFVDRRTRQLHAISVQVRQTLTALGVEPSAPLVGMYVKELAAELIPQRETTVHN